MFVRDAKALCPQLVIFPYNFDAYEEVAEQFYNILHKHCNKVQAVSCDEAFIDISDLGVEDPQLLATELGRKFWTPLDAPQVLELLEICLWHVLLQELQNQTDAATFLLNNSWKICELLWRCGRLICLKK